jgi:hypothetical protein
MACDTAGVGVNSPPLETRTCTPLAASTSSALSNAGCDSACVSQPMNSGPSMPFPCRYSQIAWLIASTCHSLKLRSNELPRWPEVPNATRCSGTAGSGRRSA